MNSINNWSANKQRQAKHIKTPYAYREIPKLLGIQSSKVLQATGHYKKHTLHIPWLNPCSQEFFLPDFSTLILTVLPCIAYCHVLPYCLLDHLLQAGTDVILSKRTRRFKCQAMSSKQVTNVTSHGHGGHASSKPPHHNISQYTDQIMSQHVTTCYCIRTVTL